MSCGTFRGHTIQVMWLADLFPYLTVVSLVHPMYTSCKSYGKSKLVHYIPCVVTLSLQWRSPIDVYNFSRESFSRKNYISCSIFLFANKWYESWWRDQLKKSFQLYWSRRCLVSSPIAACVIEADSTASITVFWSSFLSVVLRHARGSVAESKSPVRRFPSTKAAPLREQIDWIRSLVLPLHADQSRGKKNQSEVRFLVT